MIIERNGEQIELTEDEIERVYQYAKENRKDYVEFAYTSDAKAVKEIFGVMSVRLTNLVKEHLENAGFQKLQKASKYNQPRFRSNQKMTMQEARNLLKEIFVSDPILRSCIKDTEILHGRENLNEHLQCMSVTPSQEFIQGRYDARSIDSLDRSAGRETEQARRAMYILTICPEATDMQIKNITGLGKAKVDAIRDVSMTITEMLYVVGKQCSKAEEAIFTFIEEHDGYSREELITMLQDLYHLGDTEALEQITHFEEFKEEMQEHVHEMLSIHVKPLKELVYDELNQNADQSMVTVGKKLMLDVKDTRGRDYQRLTKIYRKWCEENGIEISKEHRKSFGGYQNASEAVHERRQALLEIHQRHPSFRIQELASALSETAETVRNDIYFMYRYKIPGMGLVPGLEKAYYKNYDNHVQISKPKSAKYYNALCTIRQAMEEHPEWSQKEIANYTRYSVPTISRYMKEIKKVKEEEYTNEKM